MTTASSPALPRPPTTAEATSADFWRELCPALSIEGPATSPLARLPAANSALVLLREEGYIHAPDVFTDADTERLYDGIRRLVERGIPPPFAFVYDEYWSVFRGLSAFLLATLGDNYRMLPDVWAWHVHPSEDAAGWVPHRDRSGVTVDPDNSPHSLTVWLPLTDATPLNGCMYVLPARHDPDLRTANRPEDGVYRFAGDTLQNIRALPATAGSLLAWNQSLLHWGSRASHLGTHPRCSIAAQFQRGDLPPLERPLFDPTTPPSFADRLGLLGHLFCVFSGFLGLPPEIRVVATALNWKYWLPRTAS